MPGLRRIAGRVARDFPGEVADIDAEIVASFVEAVHTLDPRGGRLASRLLGIPWNRAKVARRAEMANIARHVTTTASAAPPRPWGHPDLVLDRAVAAGVITAAEAELIGATRLGGLDLASAAADIGVPYETLRRRRFRAERRLVAWMANESSPVPNETARGICRCGSTSGDRQPAGRRCAVGPCDQGGDYPTAGPAPECSIRTVA
jgi:DNA-directed RNA polymerase specialized sigma24 family protein